MDKEMKRGASSQFRLPCVRRKEERGDGHGQHRVEKLGAFWWQKDEKMLLAQARYNYKSVWRCADPVGKQKSKRPNYSRLHAHTCVKQKMARVLRVR